MSVFLVDLGFTFNTKIGETSVGCTTYIPVGSQIELQNLWKKEGSITDLTGVGEHPCNHLGVEYGTMMDWEWQSIFWKNTHKWAPDAWTGTQTTAGWVFHTVGFGYEIDFNHLNSSYIPIVGSLGRYQIRFVVDAFILEAYMLRVRGHFMRSQPASGAPLVEESAPAEWLFEFGNTRGRYSGGYYLLECKRTTWYSAEFKRLSLERGITITDTFRESFTARIHAYGSPSRKRFHLGEGIWMDMFQSVSPYHRRPAGLQSELFRETLNSATLNTNNIANVISVIDLIKDIRKGNLFEIFKASVDFGSSKKAAKTAANAWLQYRYSYTTTMMDIKEITDNLGNAIASFDDGGIQMYRGRARVSEGLLCLKCKMKYHAYTAAQDLYVKLKRLGAAPDLYNLWDLVPFSFVVDWFLPVGSALEDISSNWVATTNALHFLTILWSWKWEDYTSFGTASGPILLKSYQRWLDAKPPALELYDTYNPSSKTWVKRICDGSSLIIGGMK